MLPRKNLRFERSSRLIPTLVLAFGLVHASAAWGAPSDADRATARKLGYQGVEAYQAGDYATAEGKLRRAFDVVKVPTLGLWLARALTKNLVWVEAAEVYREVARLEVTEGKVEAQQEAQRTAESELRELEGTIPAVVIVVEGTTSNQVVVEIDGVQVPSAVLGEARPMNPGRHRIVGKLGDQVVERTVELASGQKRDLKLVFQSERAKPATKRPAAGVAPDAPPPASGDTQRLVSWAALGVGAAGLVTGGVTGVLVLGKKSDLEDNAHCRGTVCEPPAHGDVDSYNRLRTISGVSFIVGGVAAALGATLLFTSGGDTEDESGAVGAYVGVGHAGVRGSF